jgi:ABC-type multidrug transport system fused ATPase/permease subunit
MKVAKFCLILMVLLMFSSCSIQKRHYNKGYYVSWNKSYISNKVNTSASNIKVEKKTELKKKFDDKNIDILKKKNKDINKIKTQSKKRNVMVDSNDVNHSKTEIKTHYFNKKRIIKETIKLQNVPTDSTKTNDSKLKNDDSKLIKNKKADIAFITFLISLSFFSLGFIAIVFAYFMAIKALIEIRNNRGVYLKNSKIKAQSVIISFNVIFLILSIILGIIFISEPLVFILLVFSLFYVLLGLIGLIILFTKSTGKGKKDFY